MRAKDFQQAVIDRFDTYIDTLVQSLDGYEKVKALRDANPDLPIPLPHFPETAWETMRQAGEVGRDEEYSRRQDGCGRPVPCVTVKVPTGGGKTFLAVSCVASVASRYIGKDDPKFVLWIVPNEAIYTQTKKQLTDQEHPYRQLLNRVSGGRVKILDKDSALSADDVMANLCVMLLMLPSANRETQATLKLFQDRGNIHGFFPDDVDQPAHQRLKGEIPNLDFVDQAGGYDPEDFEAVGFIRQSRGNALRLIRPVVVMDEGHKAFSELAVKTLYGFNPRLVIELTATPKDGDNRKANWLVNVTGEDLDREQMIKMPIEVHVLEVGDWRDCLREAWQQTERLREQATLLDAEKSRYIRPILLVQVERVGKDQRDGQVIHSEDAKEFLIGLGIAPDAIAIKTADQNDLKNPENQNLLDRGNPVRVIITKQALQEGWDCPFAYVLCALAVSHSTGALTQLLGRILRQPDTVKTGRALLDQCYVFTQHQKTGEIMEAIKKGLAGEGMGDLAGKIVSKSGPSKEMRQRVRREPFREKKYYLPEVLVVDGLEKLRPLDWETDILPHVDWSAMPAFERGRSLSLGGSESRSMVAQADINVIQTGAWRLIEQAILGSRTIDLTFVVRALSTVIANPWVARAVVDAYVAGLRENGWTDRQLGDHEPHIISELIKAAQAYLDEAARVVFEDRLGKQMIRFHLTVTDLDWFMPDIESVEAAASERVLCCDDGRPVQRSLFDPFFAKEVNGLELQVACFLDKQEAVTWWYRNLVRNSAYGLAGWRRGRIYPDFIIAEGDEDGVKKWLVLETKGKHLIGNEDTEYKRALLDCLSGAYEAQSQINIGQLTIQESRASYKCKLIAQSTWEQEIASLLGQKQ